MKRQSTTARLSRSYAATILAYCQKFTCGVIIRICGVEVGIDASDIDFGYGANSWLRRNATVLKATMRAIADDNATCWSKQGIQIEC